MFPVLLTQRAYLAMLKGFSYSELTEMENVIFQYYDGTPVEWGLRVPRSLDQPAI